MQEDEEINYLGNWFLLHDVIDIFIHYCWLVDKCILYY